MPLVLQEAKRQLEEVRAELASERSAHDATKQALKRESEQREAAVAAAVALPAAAAVPAAVASHPISSPGDKSHGTLSPREAAEVRQQVLDLEVSCCSASQGQCLVWQRDMWLDNQQMFEGASAALCIALRTQECCPS